ncbi:uroporphyrinogen III decarboxylase [Treponema sp. OttesenSCG-928-L16]|nr:uroporphyrinogen III decarboxylase [Treponema sp. OttesenSCG-928-L16]
MTKKERVIAAITGKAVDYPPASFSLHFPEECKFREKGIDAHLRFFSETDTDIYKIMTENLIPSVPGISEAPDWEKIPSFSRHDPFIADQIDFVKAIRDKTPADVFLLGTIHGVCASTIHPLRPQYSNYDEIRHIHVVHYRKNKAVFRDAVKRISEAQCILMEETIKAGVDGIYYAALGGEKNFYTDEEFSELIEPFDKEILSVCREMGCYSFLHICKKNLNIERYRSYVPYTDVVNWGIYENGIYPDQVRRLFPDKTIMGGFANRSGVLVEGTRDEIAAETRKIILENGPDKFILGADCTLPTAIPYQNIRYAVMAARNQIS